MFWRKNKQALRLKTTIRGMRHGSKNKKTECEKTCMQTWLITKPKTGLRTESFPLAAVTDIIDSKRCVWKAERRRGSQTKNANPRAQSRTQTRKTPGFVQPTAGKTALPSSHLEEEQRQIATKRRTRT